MRPLAALASLGLVLGLVLWFPGAAFAHGFGERYDLPVPLYLYVGGAAVAVAFSFVVVAVFVRASPRQADYPRLDLLRWLPFRLLSHPALLFLLKLASVALFLLLIIGGLIGNQAPNQNLAPTLVWVIWWVGIAYLSAFVGNVWALINPWDAIFGWLEGLYRWVDPEGSLSMNLAYPQWLGAWPAVALFAAFAWIELVYPDSSAPFQISVMALFYSFVSWGGMFLYGRHRWLRHGDAFALVFGVFARFSPTETRTSDRTACPACPMECADDADECVGCYPCYQASAVEKRQWNLRPPAAGLLRDRPVGVAEMTLVLLLLGSVTFDGFTATPAWVWVLDSSRGTFNFLGDNAYTGISTLGLLVFLALFVAVFRLFANLMALMAGAKGAGSQVAGSVVARSFVYSLVPIALAYHLAHFLSFLLVQGQRLIPLASDPLGLGWDLFGTAEREVDIGVIGADTVWFLAVITIVVGHIVAVFIAHVYAMRVFADRRAALRSQYPMLALMVGYTVLSLWIIAQPITEAG